MGGLRPSSPDRWDDGSVYNPQDGRIYTGEMALLADRRLRVRAHLGMPFFGQTQVWTRADRSPPASSITIAATSGWPRPRATLRLD